MLFSAVEINSSPVGCAVGVLSSIGASIIGLLAVGAIESKVPSGLHATNKMRLKQKIMVKMPNRLMVCFLVSLDGKQYYRAI